jgi:hypothetical protein
MVGAGKAAPTWIFTAGLSFHSYSARVPAGVSGLGGGDTAAKEHTLPVAGTRPQYWRVAPAGVAAPVLQL